MLAERWRKAVKTLEEDDLFAEADVTSLLDDDESDVSLNGVAVVATHSPVVLQEVPRSCAWKLRRSGRRSIVERPTVETFGENIGVLTREVFGLQVTQSGFHKLLQDAVSDGSSYRRVLNRFGGQLGDEAKAIVQALIAERDRDDDA